MSLIELGHLIDGGVKIEPEMNKPIDWLEIQSAIAEQRDEDAYKTLFFHFHSDLIYFSRSLLHDIQTAEDVVSETLVKIWTMGPKLQSIVNLKTYLYRSVKNSALNIIAKNKLQDDYTLTCDRPIHTYTPEQELISKEIIHRIEQAISGLPPKTKTVFILIRDNGCSYKEVAEIMEISRNTVDRHMQIALTKLQKALPLIIK